MNTKKAHGFSLVEVVLAIGIFAFAIVAILGLFGTSIGGVKKLGDRDVLVAAGSSIAEKVAELTRAELLDVPAGASIADEKRPVYYAYAPKELFVADASTDVPVLAWAMDAPPKVADVKGSRVFRAAVYRAYQDSGTEFSFEATKMSFPVRVVVDVMAPGQTSGEPAMTWSFHSVLIPTK
jgi:hypothetical protein